MAEHERAVIEGNILVGCGEKNGVIQSQGSTGYLDGGGAVVFDREMGESSLWRVDRAVDRDASPRTTCAGYRADPDGILCRPIGENNPAV